MVWALSSKEYGCWKIGPPSGTLLHFLLRDRHSLLELFLSWGVFQRPLTLILLQKHCDTSGRRIVIQIDGVYTTFCQKEGILLQKYRDRNGRCIAILFRSIRVRGRFDSSDELCLWSLFPVFGKTLLPSNLALLFPLPNVGHLWHGHRQPKPPYDQ